MKNLITGNTSLRCWTQKHKYGILSSTVAVRQGKFSYCKTAFIDGKLHVMPLIEKDVAAYNSKEARWELVEPLVGVYLFKDSYCQIDNVMLKNGFCLVFHF